MGKIRKERLTLLVILLGLLVVGLGAIGAGTYLYLCNRNPLFPIFPIPYSAYISWGLVAEGLFSIGLSVKVFKSI